MDKDNHNNPVYHSSRRSILLGLTTCVIVGFAVGVFLAPVTVSNQSPQAYFSPKGGAREAIVQVIDNAMQEIVAALYYFTDPILADALITAQARGVRVTLILDRSQRKARHSQSARMIAAGITIHFDSQHRIFHHKFMVVDGETLITGSQNWTHSAEHVNAENTLIFHCHRGLAQQYRTEFQRLLINASETTSNGIDAAVQTSPLLE